MEIMREVVVIEEEEMTASAEKDTRGPQVDLHDPRAQANTNNSTMGEQDLDLILNVEEHDQLDFEPEEGILDNTMEVKLFNPLFSLRPDFRTRRRRIPGLPGSKDLGCLNTKPKSHPDFIKMQNLFINEFNTILIYYLYYLYHVSRAFCPQISFVMSNDLIVCQ